MSVANASPAVTGSYIASNLIEKMNSTDKDFRFMAINDLMRELQHTQMKLDDDSERKIVRAILKLIEDTNGEVQNLAVKCTGAVMSILRESVAEEMIDKLCNNIAIKDEIVKDVCSIGLKNVIMHMPPITSAPGNYTITIIRKIVPKLTVIIDDSLFKATDAVRLEVVDMLAEVLMRFGSVVQAQHKDIQQVLLYQFIYERLPLRKRTTMALGHLSAVCSLECFNEVVEVLLEKLLASKTTSSIRTYVVAITYVTKPSGNRFSVFLPRVVPLFMKYLRESEDDDLLEAVLQAFETFFYRCPKDIIEYREEILKIVKSKLLYDPNYSYEEEDNGGESMEVEDGDEEEEQEEENYSDDDDMSWKVRRAAAKALEAVIIASRDYLVTSAQVLGPLLITRFKEREENVRADVFAAYISLINQCKLMLPPTSQSLWKNGDADAQVVIGNVAYSSAVLSNEQQTILESMYGQTDVLLKAVIRQTKVKSVKTRLLCLHLLSELAKTCPHSLTTTFSVLMPAISSNLMEKSSTTQLKIDTLIFLNKAIENHDPQVFEKHLAQLVQCVVTSIMDSFYKVASEGLLVASSIVDVILQCPASTQQHILPLFDAVYQKLLCLDIDQEVKERSIAACGHFLATFANILNGKVSQCLDVLLERLKNEMTRLYAVRALYEMVNSERPTDLSHIMTPLLPIMADFMKKNARTLKICTLQLVESLLQKTDVAVIDSEGFSEVIGEMSVLLKDSDLQITQLTLKCITVSITRLPNRAGPHLDMVIEAIVLLTQSSLLQGATLQATLDMLKALVVSPVPGKPGFEALLDTLTAPIYDVATLPRQSFFSISAATAVVASAVNDNTKANALASKLADQLQNSKSSDAIKLFSMHALGELGRRCPQVYVDGKVEPQKLIVAAFNSTSEDLKTAAALALGALAVGNLQKFLPFILKEIQTQPKRQYLLLHALKEVIAWESADGSSIDVFRARIGEIWPVLITHAECNEEGTRNIVAECLGKLCVIDPQGLLPSLRQHIRSQSASVRAAIVTSVKFMISDEKRPIDAELQGCIGEFLQTVTDSDIVVKRMALVALNSAAHNKPALIRDLLDIFLPCIYKETILNKDLIREVEMGPFKHQVDEGLDLRKAAFECMYTLLESCLNKIDVFEFITYMENGLRDNHHDIKLLTYLMLMKLSSLCPNQVIQRLDKICEPLKVQLLIKPKGNAVKQEIDKQDELKRAVIRVMLTLQKIPDAERQQHLADLINTVRTLPDLKLILEGIQRDSQRTYTGDVAMDTV